MNKPPKRFIRAGRLLMIPLLLTLLLVACGGTAETAVGPTTVPTPTLEAPVATPITKLVSLKEMPAELKLIQSDFAEYGAKNTWATTQTLVLQPGTAATFVQVTTNWNSKEYFFKIVTAKVPHKFEVTGSNLLWVFYAKDAAAAIEGEKKLRAGWFDFLKANLNSNKVQDYYCGWIAWSEKGEGLFNECQGQIEQWMAKGYTKYNQTRTSNKTMVVYTRSRTSGDAVYYRAHGGIYVTMIINLESGDIVDIRIPETPAGQDVLLGANMDMGQGLIVIRCADLAAAEKIIK